MSEGTSAWPALEIRPVRATELDLVAELTVNAYLVGGGLAEDADYLHTLRRAGDRAEASPLYVAVRGGVIVGAVSLCPHGTAWAQVAQQGELELRMLVVSPEARGTGVADALIAAAQDYASGRGDRRIVLSVISDNAPAHRLYARHGFQRTPERDWWPTPEAHLLTYSRTV